MAHARLYEKSVLDRLVGVVRLRKQFYWVTSRGEIKKLVDGKFKITKHIIKKKIADGVKLVYDDNILLWAYHKGTYYVRFDLHFYFNDDCRYVQVFGADDMPLDLRGPKMQISFGNIENSGPQFLDCKDLDGNRLTGDVCSKLFLRYACIEDFYSSITCVL